MMGVAFATKVSLVTVKEDQGNALHVFAVHFALKPFNQLYITNNTERFSYKSGYHAHCKTYVQR